MAIIWQRDRIAELEQENAKLRVKLERVKEAKKGDG
jgi:hypothetical protein